MNIFAVKLTLASIGLATVLGVIVGVVAATRAGSFVDTGLMGMAVLGLAIPSFWSALLLTLVFALNLRWLPVMGAGSLRHLVLPSLCLALPTTAAVSRFTRASVLQELATDYARTARAYGIPKWRVLVRHVLRNSLMPMLTLLALRLGRLLGGSFVVETIFAWPGLGRLMVQAIFDRDYPVVLGAALFVATVYLSINVIVDLLQGHLDPRLVQRSV